MRYLFFAAMVGFIAAASGQQTTRQSMPQLGFGMWRDIPLTLDGGGDWQSNLGVATLSVTGPSIQWNGKITPWLSLEPSLFAGHAVYLYPENAAERDFNAWGYGGALTLMPRIRFGKIQLGMGPKISNTWVQKMPTNFNQQVFTGQFRSIGLSGRLGVQIHRNWMIEARGDLVILGGGNNEYFTGSRGFGIALVRLKNRKSFF